MALLLREGLALYGLSHPALLPVLGVSIEDRSAPFLLYPHTGYRNMKRFLLRCKLSSEGPPRALTTQEVVEMALQAAKGVQYLHRKRLVHRDLAARNCVYVRIINYYSPFRNIRYRSLAYNDALMKHDLCCPQVIALSLSISIFSVSMTTWECKSRTTPWPEICSHKIITVLAITKIVPSNGWR